MARSNNEPLFAAVRAWLAVEYPGQCCTSIKLKLAHGGRVELPLPVSPAAIVPGRATTALQDDILRALSGKAMTTDDLASACDVDRRRLFKAGGVKELVTRGLVANKPPHGFYRPDDPPDELAGEVASS